MKVTLQDAAEAAVIASSLIDRRIKFTLVPHKDGPTFTVHVLQKDAAALFVVKERAGGE